jgi:hypothetical protein
MRDLLKRPARMCRAHRREYRREFVFSFFVGDLMTSDVTTSAADCDDCRKARESAQ